LRDKVLEEKKQIVEENKRKGWESSRCCASRLQRIKCRQNLLS